MIPIKIADYESEHLILSVVEDTFIMNGEAGMPNNRIDLNLSEYDTLHVKADDGTGSLHRMILLKFDISSLRDVKFSSVQINLYGLDNYEPNGAPLNLYAVDPNAWQQSTATYRTAPEIGQLVCSFNASLGVNQIAVTDYTKQALACGIEQISFIVLNDCGTPLHMRFVSGRGEMSKRPCLSVNTNPYGYHTHFGGITDSQSVWDHAAKMVDEWRADWQRISLKPYTEVELVQDDPDEYKLTVDVARVPKEPFFSNKTRILDTVKNFTPQSEESAEYDKYGGLICDTKFEKSDFYRIEKLDGRHICVTPEGNPFYRKAIVEVRPGSSQNQRESILNRFDSLGDWAEHEANHLRSLGFNSVGGWSDTELLSKTPQPLALSKIVHFISEYTRKLCTDTTSGGSTTTLGGAIPVFDPEFESFCEERARKVVTPYVENQFFFGWMSDNELHADFHLLDHYLTLDHENPLLCYSYATAWTFLAAYAGKDNVFLPDVTDEMRLLFRAMIYNRYLKLVSRSIRNYDPNHLFMGSRFLPGCYRDEYVNRVSGVYCDIITLNYYGAWTPESRLMADIVRWSGRPFVITEWYAKGMDVCNEKTRLTNDTGAGWTVNTQTERGYFYHNYALKLLECKGCVGFDWFKMWDNDPDNEKADWTNRNANKGIYNTAYEEYSELTSAMKYLNANAYRLIKHFDSAKKTALSELFDTHFKLAQLRN